MHVQVFLRLDPSMLAQQNDVTSVLQHLIAKGSVGKSTQAFEPALCQAFGIDKQANCPAAALSWLGEEGDPGDHFWFFADPVNLQLQRDHFTLNMPVLASLAEAESEALRSSLNLHFSEDGFIFLVGPSGQWYLRSAVPTDVATSFPDEAAGRDIRGFLPRGQNADQWRRMLNEIQMLLHDHPVNQQREAQGQPVINSLWLSGAGRLPSRPKDSSRLVLAQQPLARGLARWSGQDALPLPDDSLLPDVEDVLLVLEAGQQDLEQWLKHMRVWLQTRKVKHLSLHLFMLDRHLSVTLKPRDLFKFWRKPQPFAADFSW